MGVTSTPMEVNNNRAWPFGNQASLIVNDFLKYGYVLLLGIQFILSLGNRPKGYVDYLAKLEFNSIDFIFFFFPDPLWPTPFHFSTFPSFRYTLQF